jgi:hypothetical protein
VAFFVSDFAKLRTRNEKCNILVLECLGPIEFSIVMIMTPKPIVKLGFDIMP